MKTVAHGKVASSLIVVAGFATWIGGLQLTRSDSVLHTSASFFIGATAFFLVACFLPDRQTKSFFSRRSALGLMSLLLWMALKQIPLQYFVSHFQDVTLKTLVNFVVPFAIAVGSYWISIFLIRGFRAPPEFDKHYSFPLQFPGENEAKILSAMPQCHARASQNWVCLCIPIQSLFQ